MNIDNSITPFTNVSQEQWLEDRKKGLGGSDIGVILGINPHKSPLTLWMEKTGRKENVVDNNFTRAGVKLEPMVADWFHEETKLLLVNPGNKVLKHDTHEYILGTPDRVTLDVATKRNGILEIKTTGATIDKAAIPLSWFCQVNWYAGIKKSHGVSDCTENYIAWFERLTCQFDYVELQYDKDFVQYMFDMAGEFWTKYVQGDTPPPPINGADVAALYSKHQPGKVVVATPELQEMITMLSEVRQTLKIAKDDEERLKSQIQIIMKDAEAVMVDGVPAITWKAAKDALKFDSDTFASDHPDLFKRYQIQTPGSRRFLVK